MLIMGALVATFLIGIIVSAMGAWAAILLWEVVRLEQHYD